MPENNNDKILHSVKDYLGYPDTLDAFDTEILSLTISSFLTLRQLGVLTKNFYSITEATKWTDVPIDSPRVSMETVRSYVQTKVKSLFDPSQNSSVNQAIENTLMQLEFRMQVAEEDDDELK